LGCRATLGEDLLGQVEGGLIDEHVMSVRGDDLAEVDSLR
jgi:hypothetical protein